MKYDSQLVELKNLLPTSKSILIALPANANVDALASGLALFLSLEASGKQVSVVCETDTIVRQSHLFGIDHVQKTLPVIEGGNLTLTLEGVAASDNTVPALEKLDWYAENSNLNLIFHVLPGQTFQPRRIVPHYQGSGFNLIFVIGAANLNALGQIYQTNSQIFSGSHVVNIDTQSANTSFGQTNVLDTNASSLSEIMTNLITDLGFILDADTASNLLAGIFEATNNLTNSNLGAEAFMAVATLLRAGGRKPGLQTTSVPAYDWNALMSKGQPQPQTTAQSIPAFGIPITPSTLSSTQPNTDAGDHETAAQVIQPSPEERPAAEGIISETVEPEWLTPKIFKGSSLG